MLPALSCKRQKLQENSKNYGSSEYLGITAAEKFSQKVAFKPSLIYARGLTNSDFTTYWEETSLREPCG